MFDRVIEEKAAINNRKIVRRLESTVLIVFEASNGSLLIEQFQMEYDQLPEKIFLTPSRISPHANVQKINRPPGGLFEDLM